MPHVEIYTSPFCGFCSRAKRLLDNKGVAYEEIDVSSVPGARAKMTERAGGKTSVPQIFIDGKGIGGCEDMIELDLDDELDPLLGLTEQA